VATLLVAFPSQAAAEPQDFVRTDPRDLDPLGVDAQSDVSDVASDSPQMRRAAPHIVRPQVGEVLTAISGVRERGHDVRVALEDGLARVTIQLRFRSTARFPAEIRYRLPTPPRSGLVALSVCVAGRCQESTDDPLDAYDVALADAAVTTSGQAPSTTAEEIAPVARAVQQGDALVLEAAPVPSGGELTLTVSYVTPAPLRGGVVRLPLPARGHDPRAAPARVAVDAVGLGTPTIDGVTADPLHPAMLEAWIAAEITAEHGESRSTTRTMERFRCGGRRVCSRMRIAAAPRASAARDVILLIDASPSMEGPARGRLGPTLAAVLAAAPPGSSFRAAAFGARARTVFEERVAADDVPLLALSRDEGGLGSATRFEAAYRLVEGWLGRGRSPLLLIIGDGGATDGPASRGAFMAAARRGVTVGVVDLGDEPTSDALSHGARRTGGFVLALGPEADRAIRGDDVPLRERVRAVFAPTVAADVGIEVDGRRIHLGPLLAGEELGYLGPGGRLRWLRGAAAHARTVRDAGLATGLTMLAIDPAERAGLVAIPATMRATRSLADAMAARCQPSDRSPHRLPIAPARLDRCSSGDALVSAEATTEGRGIPAETVLDMLRRRVVPVARQCFRRDRRGRGDYAVRAEYVFTLRDREIEAAEVHGSIADGLRECLLLSMDGLDIPRFSGRVVVRYPVHTEREVPPPAVELLPDVARELHAVTEGMPGGAPPPP
jgi:hypothetical protein